MLIESTVHLPISLAMFQEIFHAPDTRGVAEDFPSLGSLRCRHYLDRPALFFQSGKRSFQKGARSGNQEESQSGSSCREPFGTSAGVR